MDPPGQTFHWTDTPLYATHIPIYTTHPIPCEQTDASENICFPDTSYAVGKKIVLSMQKKHVVNVEGIVRE